MQWKMVFRVVLLLVLLGAADGGAEENRRDHASRNNQRFVSDSDAVCGLGQKMSVGCQAIRAREIVDASSAPWSAIGRVNFAGIDQRQHCTGTLVSERIVLTAAHCLYNFPRKRWIPPDRVIFVAGFQRGSGRAVTRGQRYVLGAVEDSTGVNFRSAPDQDWALLVLEDAIGEDVGFLDLIELTPSDHEASDFRLAGYAGLRPNVLSVASDCGQPIGIESKSYLQRCSAMQGDSGAPLLVSDGGKYAVVGVLSSVVSRDDGFAALSVSSSQFLDILSLEIGK